MLIYHLLIYYKNQKLCLLKLVNALWINSEQLFSLTKINKH